MPEFTPSEIDIDPNEFMDACTPREIRQIIIWLEDNNKLTDVEEYYPDAFQYMEHCNGEQKESIVEWLTIYSDYFILDPKKANSLSNTIFNEYVFAISDNQNFLTKEEKEIIEKIGEKFK